MKRKSIFLPIIVSVALLGATHLPIWADDLSSAQKVRGQRVFTSPIEWIGEKEPPEADSAALLESISAFDSAGMKAGFEALENFLAKHPQSAWTPSLQIHLAERYRVMGRYSAAMKHWETAWEGSKTGTDEASRKMAARALSGWMRLLGSLGHKERLESLLDEAEQRDLFTTSYAHLLQASRESLSVMKGRPGESYRCGSFALSRVMKLLDADSAACRAVQEIPSPEGGFRMSELVVLAESNRFEVVAVQRVEGGKIPVPSVVHWKLDHYLSITHKFCGPTGNPSGCR